MPTHVPDWMIRDGGALAPGEAPRCRAYVGDCYRDAASPEDARNARRCSRNATTWRRSIQGTNVLLCAQHSRQWGTGRLLLVPADVEAKV